MWYGVVKQGGNHGKGGAHAMQHAAQQHAEVGQPWTTIVIQSDLMILLPPSPEAGLLHLTFNTLWMR